MYLHRPWYDFENAGNIMNIVVSNAESVDPTKNIDSLLNSKHAVSSRVHDSSIGSPIHQKLKKKMSLKKLKSLSKNSEFPKLKLKRKNWINFDTLSSSDSLNSVVQDFRIDYSDSHFNEKN